MAMRSNTYFDGAMVQMADGSERKVSDLCIGDFIRTKNGEMKQIQNIMNGSEQVYLFEFDGNPGDEVVNTAHAQFIENKDYKR